MCRFRTETGLDISAIGKLDDDTLFDEIRKDAELQDHIVAGISNLAISTKDYARDLQEWDYIKQTRFGVDKTLTVDWTRRYVYARKLLEDTAQYRRNDAEYRRTGGAYRAFLNSIPEEFRDVSEDDFPLSGHKNLIDKARQGRSMYWYGEQGIGKTRLAWLLMKLARKQGRKAMYRKLSEIVEDISALAFKTNLADHVNATYVDELDILIVDEADKVTMTDIQMRNVNYLLDRRYEERKQTILIGNSNEDSMRRIFGDSSFSRFGDILRLAGKNRRK